MLEAAKIKAILTLLQGCNSLKKLTKIHAHVITLGLHRHPDVTAKLLNFCAVSVSLPYAHVIFRHHLLPNPRHHQIQTQHFNSMIRGFSLSPSPLHAIAYYNHLMLTSSSSSPPDTYSFSFALKACEKGNADRKCREIHGALLRCGFGNDVVVCTGLITCYASNGAVGDARKVFDEMSVKDLVCWNSMISCYVQAGIHNEALNIYDVMRKTDDVGVDGFTIVGLLSACAHLGALNFGVRIHEIAREKGFIGRSVYVGNALIDMYAKCGDLDGALCVFERMRKRDVLTWNSLIVGYGVHGRGDEAIWFFEKMMVAGVRPNSVTFLGVLCGCSHQGLVEKGVDYFHMMGSKFDIKPGIKHYGCLVDLFGRAGKLEKALHVIRTTSCTEDDPILWRTLLSSCKIHNNVEIGEVALRNLICLGASNAGDYVLLATIYFRAKDADGVSRVRKLIKNQGVKTTPGWSWIEIGDQIHKFVVDDKSHPDTEEIYQKLESVVQQAALHGYLQEESLITASHDAECAGTSGSCHSEKLAIAFGLARTPEGKCLRIVKNLRVCRDCHSFTKFVSKAFNREIIVRDRARFHHFKGGLCGCNDYW